MVGNTMAAPAPGSPEKPQFSTEGARGDWASPSTRPAQKGVVYVDFGRNKVYTLTDDGDEVLVFNNLQEMVEKLKPKIVVVDSLPNRLQTLTAELAREITFLRLKDLRKLSEERRSNGVRKSDENDVKLLKTIYCRCPELFQPLFTSPEELVVRELTEEWVTFAYMRKVAKQRRTAIDHPLLIENHKNLQKMVIKLSEEIHREAMKLPLYCLAVEKLGLKGATLAYILSHDGWMFTTLSRDRLELRYAMRPRPWKRRPRRSRLLIALANTAVIHKHPRYYSIYNHYYEKFKDRPGKHWKAVLRVALIILRDIRKLARKYGQQTQKAGPPA